MDRAPGTFLQVQFKILGQHRQQDFPALKGEKDKARVSSSEPAREPWAMLAEQYSSCGEAVL